MAALFDEDEADDAFIRVSPPPAARASSLRRATVCIWSDSPNDEAAFQAWLKTWQPKMAFVSHDYGCGCCIHLYDILGSRDGIDAIPRRLRILSEWTENI